jgi:PAS domain S-box-containing protein
MLEFFSATLADNYADSIIGWNLTGEIVVWNPAAESLYGYSPEDLEHLMRFLPWFFKEEFTSAIAIVLGGERLHGLRELRKTKSGNALDVVFDLIPVKDGAGNVVGLLESSRAAESDSPEVTANILADRKLALSMAHDLRNSLSTLTNIAYLLEHRKESRHVEMMKKQIFFCESIVNNFLELYSGRAPHAERIHVSEVVAEVSNLINLAHEKEIRLSESPELHGWADPGHFRQALMNLLQNAMEAVDREDGRIEIMIGEENRFVRIDISDNGPGISDTILEEIFEPLVTTKSKGYGLGLAASRQLIEANQGYIHVRSKEGVGSVFSVYLPKSF